MKHIVTTVEEKGDNDENEQISRRKTYQEENTDWLVTA